MDAQSVRPRRKYTRQSKKAHHWMSPYKDSLDTATSACNTMRTQILALQIPLSEKHKMIKTLESLNAQVSSAWSKLQHERFMMVARRLD